MTPTVAPSAPCRTAWPKDALRVAFGLVWAIDAGLKWAPGFRSSYMDTIMGQAQGQPGWLHWWFSFWINLQHPRAVFFAYLVAVIETLIALALITGFARKLTYISAIVFSFLIWATAEGFGGPYTSGSSDIGTAIIYMLVFGALLALSYYAGTARYSVDYYIEQRVPWWWRVAEMPKPDALVPAAERATATDVPVWISSNGAVGPTSPPDTSTPLVVQAAGAPRGEPGTGLGGGAR